MMHDDDWDAPRIARRPLLGAAGTSILRFALLFSSAGVAFALILTPIAARLSHNDDAGIYGVDYTSTGSIGRKDNYVIRRSVLQEDGAVCIIRADGKKSGNC